MNLASKTAPACSTIPSRVAAIQPCRDPGARPELHLPSPAAQTRIVSVARIRLDSWKFVRPFKGIFCDDISEFESYHPSHAVGLLASAPARDRHAQQLNAGFGIAEMSQRSNFRRSHCCGESGRPISSDGHANPNLAPALRRGFSLTGCRLPQDTESHRRGTNEFSRRDPRAGCRRPNRDRLAPRQIGDESSAASCMY
jgi:hypothetical protein